MKPADDPKADELRNKNLSQPKEDQGEAESNSTEDDSGADQKT